MLQHRVLFVGYRGYVLFQFCVLFLRPLGAVAEATEVAGKPGEAVRDKP